VIIIDWNVSLYLIIVLAFYWNTDYVSLFLKMGWLIIICSFFSFAIFFFNIWCLLEWLFSINRINCFIYDSRIIILIFLIYFPWKKRRSTVYFYISKAFKKKIYLLQINMFFVFLDHFNVLILKIILKNKKYYFNIFLSEKHFEKWWQPHSQFESVITVTFQITFRAKLN